MKRWCTVIFGVLTLIGTMALSTAAQSFSDDFNRPDGAVGNGWSVFGGGASIMGGQLETIGEIAYGGGVSRNLTVTFPLTFSFDFWTADPADGGWFIAFNAVSTLIPGPAPAQVSFFQFAGSRNIYRNVNDPSAASPNLPEPILGWENYGAAPAHIQGQVNADLSSVITVTYADGVRVTAAWAGAAPGPIGPMLALGNSSASFGPHLFDNFTVAEVGRAGYVANAGSNSLSVINLANNTVLATVPVGRNPVHVAVTPDGTKAYVTNAGGNTVSVMSTMTNSVVATVQVGFSPVHAAVAPNGSRVYVTNALSNSVSVISTATNTVVATIRVGANPVHVAITPDGASAYVTNAGAHTVSVIGTAVNAVTATVTVGPDPVNVAIF